MAVRAALLALLMVTCAQVATAAEPAAEPPARDGVFIHISHGPEDPHRVLMALQMAVLVAADHDVLVYFDIHGIAVVLAGAEDLSFSHFPSSKTQLAKLAEMGVPVVACPGCLKAAGKGPQDLAAGIRVADKEAFFGFTKGRILTLDY